MPITLQENNRFLNMPSGEPGTQASIEGRDAVAPDRGIELFSGPGLRRAASNRPFEIPGGFRFETRTFIAAQSMQLFSTSEFGLIRSSHPRFPDVKQRPSAANRILVFRVFLSKNYRRQKWRRRNAAYAKLSRSNRPGENIFSERNFEVSR